MANPALTLSLAGGKCLSVSLRCPGQRRRAVQLFRAVVEIALAHDVVPLEHRARLVPGHRHRHAFRNRDTVHVSYGGSAEVVGDPFDENLHVCTRRLGAVDLVYDKQSIGFAVLVGTFWVGSISMNACPSRSSIRFVLIRTSASWHLTRPSTRDRARTWPHPSVGL